MAAAGRHPTDEDRARDARPIVEAAAAALRDRDADGLSKVLRADAEWLSPDGVRRGADAVIEALLAATAGATDWVPPVQLGAAAAIGFTAAGARQVVVLTVRRDGVVLAAGC